MPDAAPGAATRLLCLGRLVAQKGFDLAIAALPAILRRQPSTRLTIAGDGPERAALTAQAAALGVADAVDFAGWVAPDAVAALIAQAAIVVVPSRLEGLPAVALQAAALGRPIVAIRTGGVPEIVCDGETGLLVERDGSGLAAAILALLDDAALRARLAHAARRRARAVFDPHACFAAYDALFRRLAAPAA